MLAFFASFLCNLRGTLSRQVRRLGTLISVCSLLLPRHRFRRYIEPVASGTSSETVANFNSLPAIDRHHIWRKR